MADDKIILSVEIDGVEKEIKTLKDLKQARKDLTNEFISGNEKAAAGLAKLKDKLEDLQDAAEAVKGTGIESASTSFNLLGDSIKNLDFDKFKTSLAGLKGALASTGILLLVQGITYLIENFDELSKGSGVLAKALKVVGDVFGVLKDLAAFFTDTLGLTTIALDKATKSTVANMRIQQAAVEQRYNREITLAQAAKKQISELEIQKIHEIEESLRLQLEAYDSAAKRKKSLNEEEKKDYEQLQKDLLKATTERLAKEISLNTAFSELTKKANKEAATARLSDRQKEIAAIQEAATAEIAEIKKVSGAVVDSESEYKRLKQAEIDINESANIAISKINKKYADELKKENDEALKNADSAAKAYQDGQIEKAAKENADLQKRSDDRKAQLKKDSEDQIKLEEETSNEFLKLNKERIDKEKEQEKQSVDFKKQLTQEGFQAAQGLSDAYFQTQINAAGGNQERITELAKKQFQVNKALQLTQAVITGTQATLNAYTSTAAIPVVGLGLAPLAAAAAGLVAAANIAKIASTQFNPGSSSAPTSSSGLTGGASSPPPLPPPPPQSTNNNIPTGVLDSRATGVVRAYVVETDITGNQRTVGRLRDQSGF